MKFFPDYFCLADEIAKTGTFHTHIFIAGQIRNNIDFRICGRADNVLSQIILDNTNAADKIPKDSQGMFITHDGVIFKGYLFDEKAVFAH